MPSTASRSESRSKHVTSFQFGSLPFVHLQSVNSLTVPPLSTIKEKGNSTTEGVGDKSSGTLKETNSNKRLFNEASAKEPIGDVVVTQQLSTDTSNQSHHPMITRSKVGTTKLNPRYVLFTVTSTPTKPRTITEALKHPGWNGAMTEEMVSFDETDTHSGYLPTRHAHPWLQMDFHNQTKR